MGEVKRKEKMGPIGPSELVIKTRDTSPTLLARKHANPVKGFFLATQWNLSLLGWRPSLGGWSDAAWVVGPGGVFLLWAAKKCTRDRTGISFP